MTSVPKPSGTAFSTERVIVASCAVDGLAQRITPAARRGKPSDDLSPEEVEQWRHERNQSWTDHCDAVAEDLFSSNDHDPVDL